MVMKNLQLRTAPSRECQRAVRDAEMPGFFKGAGRAGFMTLSGAGTGWLALFLQSGELGYELGELAA